MSTEPKMYSKIQDFCNMKIMPKYTVQDSLHIYIRITHLANDKLFFFPHGFQTKRKPKHET